MAHQSAGSPVVIDIGATKTVLARFSEDKNGHRVEPFDRFPTPATGEALVQEILRALNGAGPVSHIGIGAPGPLDPRSGVFLDPPNMPGWRNFPLVQTLKDALGVPVLLENDANVGALGEALFGSGRGCPSVFYLTISTGIGAGLVVDGRIFGGYKGMAGEVHAIDPGTYFGGETGETVIERASGPGMVRCALKRIAAGMETSLSTETVDTYTLLAALATGDPVAVATVESARDALAGLLVHVLAILAPDMVVLAGGLCTDSSWFVDPVRERVHRGTKIPELREVPIERASLWDTAVLYGAAALPFDGS